MPGRIIDTETATAIVRDNVDRKLSVTSILPLHGGMVNQVEEWRTDGEPASIVAKITEAPNEQGFFEECDIFLNTVVIRAIYALLEALF